jgi:hypothetical protein
MCISTNTTLEHGAHLLGRLTRLGEGMQEELALGVPRLVPAFLAHMAHVGATERMLQLLGRVAHAVDDPAPVAAAVTEAWLLHAHNPRVRGLGDAARVALGLRTVRSGVRGVLGGEG